MRDVHEVLQEREQAIERVVREIQALRATARLLNDDSDTGMTSAATQADTEDESAGAAEVGNAVSSGAKKVSARLKQLATPLLNTLRATG